LQQEQLESTDYDLPVKRKVMRPKKRTAQDDKENRPLQQRQVQDTEMEVHDETLAAKMLSAAGKKTDRTNILTHDINDSQMQNVEINDQEAPSVKTGAGGYLSIAYSALFRDQS